MNEVVVLDSGPVGIITNPRNTLVASACRQWLGELLAKGRRVILPEITDYEVRRELIRRNSVNALINLDQLGQRVEYMPLTTQIMRLSAELWAQARQRGLQTAADHSLDGDVILAAQAISLGVPAVVASGNWAHLSRYVPAQDWQTIVP